MNARKELRRTEAQERAEAHSKRTPQEQIAVLDRRLGKGEGAQKERARLQALISNSEG